MTRITIQREESPDPQLLAQTAASLQEGQLVCFPTDTVYALAADCSNAEAIERIYSIKARDPHKPLALLAGDMKQARQIAVFDTRAELLARHFLPGALTLVLPLRKDAAIAPNVNAELTTIGIRIPNHPFALCLLRHYGKPLVATSVNISGYDSALTAGDIPESFHQHIGLIIDDGPSPLGISSTVVELSSDTVKILRQGTVTEDSIRKLLKI
jgi:L-threonylcarbamoyladenylate synthase